MKIQIFVITKKRKVENQALIDCGAKGASYISRTFATRSKIPLIPLRKTIPVLNVDGTENQDGAIHEYVDVLIEVKGRERRLSLLVTSLG